MGGYGSGRSHETAKLDEGLSLSVIKLKRDGIIALNSCRSGSLVWTRDDSGEETGSINYQVNTRDPHDMWLRVYYTHTLHEGAEPNKMDYKIRLETTQPNYGGKRLWFICPLTHKRAGVVFKPPGSKWFASRHAFNLKYQSQSRSPHDRAIDRMWKLKNRLGGDDYWRKPKGMHHKTHDRMVEEIHESIEVCDRYLMQMLRKVGALEENISF